MHIRDVCVCELTQEGGGRRKEDSEWSGWTFVPLFDDPIDAYIQDVCVCESIQFVDEEEK